MRLGKASYCLLPAHRLGLTMGSLEAAWLVIGHRPLGHGCLAPWLLLGWDSRHR